MSSQAFCILVIRSVGDPSHMSRISDPQISLVVALYFAETIQLYTEILLGDDSPDRSQHHFSH